MKKEGNLGFAIGEYFEHVCQQLETNNHNANQLISEFSAGLSFLIRQNLPFTVILLYLAEYAKKVNSN